MTDLCYSDAVDYGNAEFSGSEARPNRLCAQGATVSADTNIRFTFKDSSTGNSENIQ